MVEYIFRKFCCWWAFCLGSRVFYVVFSFISLSLLDFCGSVFFFLVIKLFVGFDVVVYFLGMLVGFFARKFFVLEEIC